MGLWGRGLAALAATVIGQAQGPRPRRRRAEGSGPGWGSWLADPRSAVLLVLAATLVLGGGRKWLQALRARRAVGRLGEPDPTPEAIREAAGHGRAALMDLFRILGTAPDPARRDVAGGALATLWARDHLIAEEEKAVVRRGYAVTWRARRRYPRGLRVPIPVEVSYGVGFLREEGDGIRPTNLEWSHRITGAERKALETFSPWRAGPGRMAFALEPGDFPTDGPHRLVLQARVRPRGLTSSWELDLPHIPFSFEFDPLLNRDALLTLADAARGEALAGAVRLEPSRPAQGESHYLDVGEEFALRDPPELVIATPLPCDLAHLVAVELEGISGRFAAGAVVLSGQGAPAPEPPALRRFALGPIIGLPADALDRPGERRLRAVLTADADRGWADPEIRSIWPGTITTDWTAVRVVRR
jgi:hypothetical protein